MKFNLVEKTLPQNPSKKVWVPHWKEPILPLKPPEEGWFGLLAYNNNELRMPMCAICGDFTERLASHIRKHNINISDYRTRFGLCQGTSLVSKRLSQVLSEGTKRRASTMSQYKENLAKGWGGRKSHSKRAEETFNRRDTCKLQTRRDFLQAVSIYGTGITVGELHLYRPALMGLIVKHWGSFNKAKEEMGLLVNPRYGPIKYDKRMIIDDILHYRRITGRFATMADYAQGKMLCHFNSLSRFGGIKKLRIEAQELWQLEVEGIERDKKSAEEKERARRLLQERTKLIEARVRQKVLDAQPT